MDKICRYFVWLGCLGAVSAVYAQPLLRSSFESATSIDLYDGEPRVIHDRPFFGSHGPIRPPRYGANLDDRLIFNAQDNLHGWEIWTMPFDSREPELLIDLNAGIRGSDPSEFVRSGDRVYFFADDGNWGRELWATDGTVSGTVRLSDIVPEDAFSLPTQLYPFDGGALFITGGYSDSFGVAFSDGTPAGTRTIWQAPVDTIELTIHGTNAEIALLDITIRDGLDTPEVQTLVIDRHLETTAFPEIGVYEGGRRGDNVLVDGNDILFAGHDEDNGSELWRATPSGISLEVDINPGAGGSFPDILGVIGNRIYFSFNPGDEPQRRRLGFFDGLAVTKQTALAGVAIERPYRLGEADNGLVIAASREYGPGTDVIQLADETVLLHFENGGLSDASAQNGRIWFRASHADLESKSAIYSTDGSGPGTVMFGPGFSSYSPGDTHNSGYLLVFANGALFSADGPHRLGTHLWSMNLLELSGNLVARTFVPDKSSNPRSVYNRRLGSSRTGGRIGPGRFGYVVVDQQSSDRELIELDLGAEPSLQPLVDSSSPFVKFKAAGSESHVLYERTPAVFSRIPGGSGVADAGFNAGEPFVNLVEWRGDGYVIDFELGGGQSGIALRRIRDGEIETVKTIYGAVFTGIVNFHGAENGLVFSVFDRVWVSDGTDTGTHQTAFSPAGFFLTPYDGGVAFTHDSPATGVELYVSDGTLDGTRHLFESAPGPESRNPYLLAGDGEVFLVGLDDGSAGLVTDGVFESVDHPDGIRRCMETGYGQVVVVTIGEEIGREPALFDCTTNEFVHQFDMQPGPASSSPESLHQVDDITYFSAVTSATGRELFAIDHSTLTPYLVADILPGPLSSSAGVSLEGGFIAGDHGRIYFPADGGDGNDLWSFSVPAVRN